MNSFFTSIKSHLFPIVFVILLILINIVAFSLNFNIKYWGVIPLKFNIILNIFTAPIPHGSFTHLFSNVIPLFFTTFIISFYFHRVKTIIYIVTYIFPGLFVWFVGRNSLHIGASGVLYAHLFFILFFGIFRAERIYMILSLIIILFNGSIIWGIFPLKDGVSWESHLGGGLIGVLLAFYYRKHSDLKYINSIKNSNNISTTFDSDNINYEIQKN